MCGKDLPSNKCTVIIIGAYRPPDQQKIPEFTSNRNEFFSSISQSDHVFIVGNFNINFLDPFAIEIILLSNQIILSIIKSTVRYIQHGIFLLDITDHYTIFAIVPIKINCPQNRILGSEFGRACEKRKLKVNVGKSKVIRYSRYGNAWGSNACDTKR